MSKKKKPQSKNLFKRGDSWYVVMMVDGKRIQKSYGSDKNAALAVLAELDKTRSLIRMGELEHSDLHSMVKKKSKRTFAHVAEDFMKAKAIENKQNTMYDYRRMLDNYILPAIGSKRIDQITRSELDKMKTWLADGKLSPRTTNKVLILTGAIFKLAHRQEEIKDNPMLHVDRCKTEKRKNNVLSLDELKAVLEALPDQWKPICTFLAYTGCRHNEAFALRWRDIQWKKNQVEITRGRARGREEGSPKTQSSIRTIPIMPPVRKMLDVKKASMSVFNPDGYVFVSPRAQMPFNDTKALNNAWQAAMVKTGLNPSRSYELRHSFASNLIEAGIPITAVSETLGHADINTTCRTYANVIKATRNKNHDLMSAIFDESKVDEQSQVTTEVTTG